MAISGSQLEHELTAGAGYLLSAHAPPAAPAAADRFRCHIRTPLRPGVVRLGTFAGERLLFGLSARHFRILIGALGIWLLVAPPRP